MTDALEVRHGKLSWVLRKEYKTRNLFQPDWWSHIRGVEHQWARALNSSQCFAVNLFAPLADRPIRAHSFLSRVLPASLLQADDGIRVSFERTPDGAAEWLGERRQATQVDVLFEVTRKQRTVGFVLIEVKFTERGFGSCRGWTGKSSTGFENPNRERCRNAERIAVTPQTECWMAEVEGRRYWESIARTSSSLRLDRIRTAGGCPFRHGLYQLMRNRVLADELTRRTGAWTEFAVCRHPVNDHVCNLEEPVADERNAIAAFQSLSSTNAVRDWDANEICGDIRVTDEALAEWHAYMNGRYFTY